MTTFSQLVDDIALELLRPDLKAAIASYTNQTLRELHFKPGDNKPGLFDANREEDEVILATDNPWLWNIPSVTRFQQLESAYCVELGRYIEAKNPRITMKESMQPFSSEYYYRSGSYLAFSGVKAGHTMRLSYFMYVQTHGYKAIADRLCTYVVDSDSYVLIVGGGVPTEAQLAVETNWLLQRWDSAVREGVRAKIWKRLGDGDRTRMAYSAFESMRASIWNTEPTS